MRNEIEAYNKGYRVTENGEVISHKGKTIKLYLGSAGYYKFSFRSEEKIKDNRVSFCVHRLQAFQKYGQKLFRKGIEVRHKDGVKANNSWDNILIGTHSENMMDIPKHIRIEKALYATSFVRKYDKEDVIKFHKENGNSYKKTMEEFGISSKGTLHFILNK
jgi:hypothetical protein